MAEEQRKRRFRGIKIALGILLGLWLLVIGIIQLVLTDKFLTKAANKIAAEYVDGELTIGRISASVFRNFPNLNIEIDDITLVYPHEKFAAWDNLGYPHHLRNEGRAEPMDTLARVAHLSASIDYSTLLEKKVRVHKAILDGARIFAHQYDATTANWSILKFLQSDKTDTTAAPMPDITVSHAALTGRPYIVYTAPSDTLFALIDSRDIRFDGRFQTLAPDESKIGLTIDSLYLAARLPADSATIRFNQFSLQDNKGRYDIAAEANASLGLAGYRRMDLPVTLSAGVSFPEKDFKSISVKDLYLKAAAVQLTGEGDVILRPDSTYIRAEALIDDCPVADVTAFLGDNFVPELKKLKTDAVISLTALCDGWYLPADKTLPELVAEISIPKSALAWQGFDYSGRLAAEVNAETDKYGNLSIMLDDIDLDMAGVNLKGTGFCEDLLCDDPLISMDLQGKADLDVINDFLPEGMTAQGAVDAAVSGMVLLSDLDLYNFSRADLDGHLTSPGIRFHDAPDSLDAYLGRTDIRLTKSKSDDMALGADILGVRGLVDSLYATYGRTTFIRGTAIGLTAQNAATAESEEYGREVHPIVGTLTAQSVAMTGEDSLYVAAKNTRNAFKYSNRAVESGTVPLISLTSRNEELHFRQGVNRIGVNDAFISATALKREPRERLERRAPGERLDSLVRQRFETEEGNRGRRERSLANDGLRSKDINIRLDESAARYLREWDASGSLEIGDGLLITPYFPLRNTFSDVKGSFTLDKIQLDNLTLTAGQSDISAQGTVDGLRSAMLRGGIIDLDLDVTSEMLNANELLAAYDAGTKFTPEDKDVALDETISDAEYLDQVADDSLADAQVDSTLIILPGNLDATVHVLGNQILYSSLEINWFAADAVMKDRCLQITNTVAMSNMGDIYFEGFYASRRKDDLTVGFDLNMVDITAEKVITLFPAVDSLVPLLKTFKGMLDCELAATGQMDTLMTVMPATINGVMRIKGTNLSVEENEALKKVARILMFRDRKMSRVDAMSVEGLIGDNTLEIFPFVVDVDRYQLAMSGIQSFDENFDYHISVLRSPLPFRFGVNLWGTFDNWRYRIGRARYKSANVPVYTTRLDSLQYNLVESIHNIFARGVETAVQQNQAGQNALTHTLSGEDALEPMDSLSVTEQAALDSLRLEMDILEEGGIPGGTSVRTGTVADNLQSRILDMQDQMLSEGQRSKPTLCERIRAFFCPRKRDEIRQKYPAYYRKEDP